MTMAGAIDDEDWSHCMVTVMIAVDTDDEARSDYSVGDMPALWGDVDNKRSTRGLSASYVETANSAC